MIEWSIEIASLFYRGVSAAAVIKLLPATHDVNHMPCISRLDTMNRILEYTILDVFAEHPLEGNPLAVFHDGRGLSDTRMQAIARETNLSETTFVLPSGDPEHDRTEGVRVRIFTTQEELPFAGHPTLGTASWLHLNHPPLVGARELKLLLNVGAITVRLESKPEPESGVFATMWQNDAVFGDLHDRAEIAGVLGLTASSGSTSKLSSDSPFRSAKPAPGSPPNARAGSTASLLSSRRAFRPRLTRQTSGAHACSSTPAKILLPALLQAARSHGWYITAGSNPGGK
jgi:hypothetical protein